ncbi:Glyoxylase, beta-lactamase superfamily II [Anoxybacillus pushchinoensis]|uniref:Glyoxylase, beta-lactamase superfamily II n=1 Tax=Anoxybacillus pushchinoensis TaxID=150248 RepID=A0A1I0SRE1_9BACL|nr:MBL fold metallo-hydrolase [Anoxybacillus pushchinoensis]SFA42084.1 Glyoxylase, beta-lactamase superfamily II [Anoxybacillus pushchinoensis]
MKWNRIPLGPLQTNAYVLVHEDQTCLVFDPGDEGEKLIEYITANGWTPLAVLLTHAHFDHIGAVDDIRKRWSIPVYVHKQEQHWLTDPMKNGSLLFMREAITVNEADVLLEGEQTLTIGAFSLQVFETPGHSPGSVSYYVEKAHAVVSGDVLFLGSIGRTDLPGGDYEQLLQSIHRHLLVLPEETVVLCGHGPETTIGAEMDTNPFLNRF